MGTYIPIHTANLRPLSPDGNTAGLTIRDDADYTGLKQDRVRSKNDEVVMDGVRVRVRV